MFKFNDFLRNFFGTHGEPDLPILNAPLFITGCMRSGTTILVDELSSHPQLIKIGVELNKIWTEIGGASMLETCPCSENLTSSPLYGFNMTSYFNQFVYESKSIKRHLMRAKTKLENNLGCVFYDWKNLTPINKSPHLVNKVQYVNSLFPESKFIYIVRDIYNQSASLKIHLEKLYKQKNEINYFNPSKNNCWERVTADKRKDNWESENIFPGSFKTIPLSWIKLNTYGLKSLNKIGNKNSIVLNYDDLLANKNSFYNYIFNFLKLSEDYQAVEEKIKTSKAKVINTTTKGALNKKWQQILSKEEIEIIDEVIKANNSDYSFIENERSMASKKIESN